jgi:hypothetical protein
VRGGEESGSRDTNSAQGGDIEKRRSNWLHVLMADLSNRRYEE